MELFVVNPSRTFTAHDRCRVLVSSSMSNMLCYFLCQLSCKSRHWASIDTDMYQRGLVLAINLAKKQEIMSACSLLHRVLRNIANAVASWRSSGVRFFLRYDFVLHCPSPVMLKSMMVRACSPDRNRRAHCVFLRNRCTGPASHRERNSHAEQGLHLSIVLHYEQS